jgi:acetyl esterase/lipase
MRPFYSLAVRVMAAGTTLLLTLGIATSAPSAGARPVDENANLSIPAHTLPYSDLASAEAKKAYVGAIERYSRFPRINPGASPEEWRKTLEQFDEVMYSDLVARQRALYPVKIEQQKIGGVPTEVFTPESGVSAANKQRVLVNLHGGGFLTGSAGPGGRFESIPVASLGKIKVIAVDYRQGPQYAFPAASEDVAAVYRELLKTYQPENIGIYGSSAGGLLTAQAVAWFQKHGLPRPGAVGVWAAGAGTRGRGDSASWGATAVYSPPAEPRSGPATPMGYMAKAKLDDPLGYPATSAEVLRQFPPTLLITGTRAGELSSAAVTHAMLLKQGVDSMLYVTEGGWHGSFYLPDVPESRDALEYAVRWFDRHLGKP